MLGVANSLRDIVHHIVVVTVAILHPLIVDSPNGCPIDQFRIIFQALLLQLLVALIGSAFGLSRRLCFSHMLHILLRVVRHGACGEIPPRSEHTGTNRLLRHLQVCTNVDHLHRLLVGLLVSSATHKRRSLKLHEFLMWILSCVLHTLHVLQNLHLLGNRIQIVQGLPRAALQRENPLFALQLLVHDRALVFAFLGVMERCANLLAWCVSPSVSRHSPFPASYVESSRYEEHLHPTSCAPPDVYA